MASTNTNGVARSGLTGLLGPSRPRPDTGEPLNVLLAKSLGLPHPKIGELEMILGGENFSLLMQNPKIKQAAELWADAKGEDRSSLIKPLATLIAHEACEPDLTWRIRQEIAKLK